MHVASLRGAAIALALCAALGGCGKSLSSQASPHGVGSAESVLSQGGAMSVDTTNTTRLGGSNPASDAAAVAIAAYPGLTRATRPRAAVLVDAGDWPAALAASVLSGAPLHAPLLYSEGANLPDVSRRALREMKPTGTGALGPAPAGVAERTQVIQIGRAPAPAGYATRSIAAGEPAAIAVAVERLASNLQRRSPHQLILTAADGPPALTMPAAGLSAQTGAPILYVERTALPRATADELARLGHTSIYLLGPRTLISDQVARELARFGSVTRIAGDSPTSNAIEVARFSDGSFGWGIVEPGHGLVFASSARPLDAPAAALLSASGDYGPLLLLESPNGLSTALSSYLSDLQPGSPPSGPVHGVYNHGWLIGDESAISATAQAQLDSLLRISSRPTAEPSVAAQSTASSESTQNPGP